MDIKRIIRDMEKINSITATPGKGCTRFSYSPEDDQARAYVFDQLKKLGMDWTVDAIGNIRALYGPRETGQGTVMIGSHMDTVGSGGGFDGLTGVVAALEVIRSIDEDRVELKRPIEFVVFAEEEGSNFGSTTLGSKAITGKLELEDLKSIEKERGLSAYDFLVGKGYRPEDLAQQQIEKGDIYAMLELHVEQGAVLDQKGLALGVVHAIAGMNTLNIVFEGASNHAGTTPMAYRNDPLPGVAELITYAEDLAKNHSNETSVATVGRLVVSPNMSNVINYEVDFNVDIRDVNLDEIQRLTDLISAKAEEIGQARNLKVSTRLIGKSKPVALSARLIEKIRAGAKSRDIDYLDMNSGAVHDSMMLTDLTDVGMIFVPSIGGISHSPEEKTEYEDIGLGVEILKEVVLDLATE